MWKTKQLLVQNDFDSREHCAPATVWFSTFFKIVFTEEVNSGLKQILSE